jgi:hypothetical protein
MVVFMFQRSFFLFAALSQVLIAHYAVAQSPSANTPAASHVSDKDYERHVAALRHNLPSRDFSIVISRPFVVIGDESPEVVQQRADDTVAWAVKRLKAEYFRNDPDEIIDIWLFRDKESYETNCGKLFHKKPDTPYGYFSRADKAMVMNIATGGGTLVHEIVHPFVAANFPHCPAWFNEGLGSLYEQSGERQGHIIGRPNWRLPGLQKAIRENRVPTFESLCKTNDTQFYGERRGVNYAMARYLCYYLQEHGKLKDFYKKFVAEREKDPPGDLTGYATLQKVLGREDMVAFQKEWQAYVMKLRFPE